jgi:hypothetical protein
MRAMRAMRVFKSLQRGHRGVLAGLLVLAGSAVPWTAAAGRGALAAGERPAGGGGERSGSDQRDQRDQPAGQDRQERVAAGLAAFDTIQAVLQHPRCQNCHIPGDAPLQFDEGVVHAQNVKRGPDGKGAQGMRCSTCHAERNPPASYGPHMPPGAPNWGLPPPARKMVFIGLSKADLCATIKDPRRNGGRNLAAVLEHVSRDRLVLWGWDPGVGRAPVTVPHDAFVAGVRTWIEAGAPCPE